jgi:predicted MPP superfamily phosphohydrolase
MNGWRFAVFLTVVLLIWAAMHAYVFGRLAGVPWVSLHISRRTLWLIAISLWAMYPLARFMEASPLRAAGMALEFVAANWIGTLFLLFAALLVADAVTLFGLAFPQCAPAVRGWAAVVGLCLSVVALVQGFRTPVLRRYEVVLPDLPAERDGVRLVQISDLHLGTLIGQKWLARLVDRVNALKPDLIAVVGDLVDSNIDRVESLIPTLRQLRAPLGVYAVTGNHEFYAGAERCVQLFEAAGLRPLRDTWSEAAPGLVIAGVDDLTARGQFGPEPREAIANALTNRPAGGVVLLSHTPWQIPEAQIGHVGLMLSGHTHNGQIWPFNYIVRSRYALLGGRYDLRRLTVIVCRGTGTWGPRMRLWRPSEFVEITLRAPARVPGAPTRDTKDRVMRADSRCLWQW